MFSPRFSVEHWRSCRLRDASQHRFTFYAVIRGPAGSHPVDVQVTRPDGRTPEARLSLEIDSFGLGFLDFDWGLPELPGEYGIALAIAGEPLGEWQLDAAAAAAAPTVPLPPPQRVSPPFASDRPTPALGSSPSSVAPSWGKALPLFAASPDVPAAPCSRTIEDNGVR